MSHLAFLVKNVLIDPSSAYLMEESPRAPQMMRSGSITSIMSSFSVSRMRPAFTITSTFLMLSILRAASTWSSMESRKSFSRLATRSTG